MLPCVRDQIASPPVHPLITWALMSHPPKAHAFQEGLRINPSDRAMQQGFWDAITLVSQNRADATAIINAKEEAMRAEALAAVHAAKQAEMEAQRAQAAELHQAQQQHAAAAAIMEAAAAASASAAEAEAAAAAEAKAATEEAVVSGMAGMSVSEPTAAAV